MRTLAVGSAGTPCMLVCVVVITHSLKSVGGLQVHCATAAAAAASSQVRAYSLLLHVFARGLGGAITATTAARRFEAPLPTAEAGPWPVQSATCANGMWLLLLLLLSVAGAPLLVGCPSRGRQRRGWRFSARSCTHPTTSCDGQCSRRD